MTTDFRTHFLVFKRKKKKGIETSFLEADGDFSFSQVVQPRTCIYVCRACIVFS